MCAITRACIGLLVIDVIVVVVDVASTVVIVVVVENRELVAVLFDFVDINVVVVVDLDHLAILRVA